jgi:hypothetical protein
MHTPRAETERPLVIMHPSWRKIRLERLNRLTTTAPEHLRWHWDDTRKAMPLILVDHRQRRWEFKLHHGAQIRPEPEPTPKRNRKN